MTFKAPAPEAERFIQTAKLPATSLVPESAIDPMRLDIGDYIRALGVPYGFYDDGIPTTEKSVFDELSFRAEQRRKERGY